MKTLNANIKSHVLASFLALAGMMFAVTSAAAVLQQGDVLVTVANGIVGNQGGVLKIDPATNAHTVISSAGAFVDPSDVAVDQNGDIYVADFSAKIIKVDSSTGSQTIIHSGAPLNKPTGIFVDSNNTILVADYTQGIFRIDQTTGTPINIASGGFLERPQNIVADAAGNIFVADWAYDTAFLGAAGGAVIKIDPSGNQSIVSQHGAFFNPHGVTMDAAGDLYVADKGDLFATSFDGFVVKVDQNTGAQTIISNTDFRSPSDIALESDGSILVADRNNLSCGGAWASVTRIDPNTGNQTTLTPCGSFVDMTGITVVNNADDSDSDGVNDDTDNCPVIANSDQSDIDMDGLGDLCDACPFDFNNDADGDGLCGDVDAEVGLEKAKVYFNNGKVKIEGNLSLPAGYWSDNLDSTGSVTLTVANQTLVDDQGVVFASTDLKKWKYEDKDLLLGNIKKFEVDWKGAKFDYKGEDDLELKTTFIGGDSTTLEIYSKHVSGPFTVMIGGTLISFDADRNITTSPTLPAEDIDPYKDDNTRVFFTLPDQLQSSDAIIVETVAGGYQTIPAQDHYTEGRVKYKLEAHFDPALFPNMGATTPADLGLDLSLGNTIQGIGGLDSADWDEIKDDKWKR